MLIRFKQVLAEIDTVEYISEETPSKQVINVLATEATEKELNELISKPHMNVTHSKFVNPSRFDADEKIVIKGLSFKRNNEEVYFLDRDEDTATKLTYRLATDKFLDLRGI